MSAEGGAAGGRPAPEVHVGEGGAAGLGIELAGHPARPVLGQPANGQGGASADLSRPLRMLSTLRAVFHVKRQLSSDGRVDIEIDDDVVHLMDSGMGADAGRRLSIKELDERDASSVEGLPTVDSVFFDPLENAISEEEPEPEMKPILRIPDKAEIPQMQIAIMIVGSRGDVQPFIALGLRLQQFGHRVRLATHEAFRDFVTSNGLEFYPLGGDPKKLMAYMTGTGGKLLPTSASQLLHDVPEYRKILKDIIYSTWGAATQADPGPPPPEGDQADADADAEAEADVLSPGPSPPAVPFVADALIANPPCYGHIHVAEALHIPLQMVFTMPWSPTHAFPHPLANLSAQREWSWVNRVSYSAVDQLTWQGIGGIINQFRKDVLCLAPLPTDGSGAYILNTQEVPFSYLWSPALIPKPRDWGPLIDVAGFSFVAGSGMSDYEPPEELDVFLKAGEKPIFVGFGSIVVDDPDSLTATILSAAKQAGVRVLMQSGWAKIGKGVTNSTDLHVIGPAPHDWLLPQCSAACHHGGAGTTAAGLRAGLPTIVVPFFGDQHFWGAMVGRTGAGPTPLPFATLTVDDLAAAFKFVRTPEAQKAAQEMAASFASEDGPANAVDSFHKNLPLGVMRCDILKDRVAHLWCESCHLKLSYEADRIIHGGSDMSTPEFPDTDFEDRPDHQRSIYRYCDWDIVQRASLIHTMMGGMGGAWRETVSGFSGAASEISNTDHSRAHRAVKASSRGMVTPLRAGIVFLDHIADGLLGEMTETRDGRYRPKRELKTGIKKFGRGLAGGATGLFLDPARRVRTARTTNSSKTRAALMGLSEGLFGLVRKPAGAGLALITHTLKGGIDAGALLFQGKGKAGKPPLDHLSRESSASCVTVNEELRKRVHAQFASINLQAARHDTGSVVQFDAKPPSAPTTRRTSTV